jgi:hypothetical protein
VRKRLAGAITLFVLALLLQAPPPIRAGSPGDGDSVIVRYRPSPEAEASAADGHQLSLSELGYRTLQVPEGVSRDEFMAQLRGAPGVLSVEPDAPVYAAASPDDTYYRGTQLAYLGPLGAPAAWDLVTGNHKIIVAILDSGTDLGHPDLAGRLWENPRDALGDGIDRDSNGCINDRYGCRFVNLTAERRTACGYTTSAPTGAVSDDHGQPGATNHSHGTMVAGILGAAGNNGIGTTGVAWNIQIMTVKVLDCGVPSRAGEPGGDISNVAQGIDYARRMGANIISLSLASRSGDTTADTSILRDAMRAAQDAGVIVVAAAGNHSPGGNPVPGYPAAYTQYTNLVAVGAADNLNGNTYADYSNYGPSIALAAPGNSLAAPVRSDLGLANPYGLSGPGTSFATPLVSGLFALMMSRNSGLSPAEYIQMAKASATPATPAPDGRNWAGAGIINYAGAVARVPALVGGGALNDWLDAPAGSTVRAIIDGAECGSATSTRFAGLSSYSLRVRSSAEQNGCGEPGKFVLWTIDGKPAFPTLPWGGRDADLSLPAYDISTVSPLPGLRVTQVTNGQWSQLAHLAASGGVPGSLGYLPQGWLTVLNWDPKAAGVDRPGGFARYVAGAPSYVQSLDRLDLYTPYWVFAPATTLDQPNPGVPAARALTLAPGWNNVVYTGQNRAVADALADISGKYTQVLQYDNITGRWLSHIPGQSRLLNDFGGLFQLRVYWIFIAEPAILTMR